MSSVWGAYKGRIENLGGTKRGAAFKRATRTFASKEKDSLSFHSVIIDGVKRDVSIINSDNLNEKRLLSMPGEDIKCGALVEWSDNWWLVSEKDANDEIYTRAKMLQCNYLLKWVDSEGKINETWSVVEDGTKYMSGEYEDRNFIMARGDSRVMVMVPRNEDTAKLNRDNRFIIDDPLSSVKMAFTLSKPLKVGRTYNDEGVFAFVCQEVLESEYDNLELGIADYYKYFPKADEEVQGNKITIDPENNKNEVGREVWL